ncbi:MAG: enoyl-CoA hydratase [Longimicrobiales bacterium]
MTGSAGTIRIDRKGPRLDIVLDRPEARNALTMTMYDALEATLEEVAGDRDVRVVVLRGAGQAFSGGTDIAQLAAFESADEGVTYERRIERVFSRLESLPQPTVAAVKGVAAGAGLLLSAACDLRVCSPDARFGAPIARTVGNALSLANAARLVALLGPSRVRAMLLTASMMDSAEAMATGFVVRIVPALDMDAHIDALCEKLCAHAPLTLSVTKQTIQHLCGRMSGADAALDPTASDDLLRSVYGSRDFKEGVTAFLTGRPPRWEGR